MINTQEFSNFIENAFREDVGDGDHSSLSCIPADAMGKAQLIVKEDGIIAGIEIGKQVFAHLDKGIIFNQLIKDGSRVKKGDIAFTVSGRVHSILKAERLMLNIMQRMSGIATKTDEYCAKLNGLKTKVLDTRKTTPGMRILEKMAVKLGGGVNHRIGLYDMIMLKDNHVDYAGGIKNAINNANKYLADTGKDLKIEIELRNLNELKEVIETGGVHRIMLDNFDITTTHKAVEMIGGRYETESSGGITIDTLRDYAECGVDYISVGALTHHIKSLDMSLKAF